VNGLTVLWNDGTGHFTTPPGSVTVPGCGTAVVAADFDKDGDPDLAVAVAGAGYGPSSVQVLRNLGGGHFVAPVSYAVAPYAFQLVAGDLDGNTRPDLVVGTSSGFDVLLNGTGTDFQPAVTFNAFSGPIALGDVDRDGDLDVMLTN